MNTATSIALATTASVAVNQAISDDNSAQTIECVNFMNNFNPKWDISSKQHYAECVELIYPKQDELPTGVVVFGVMAAIIIAIILFRS